MLISSREKLLHTEADIVFKLTAPAPYLSAALMNDMMAIFKLNSSLWCPVVRSKSFISVYKQKIILILQ